MSINNSLTLFITTEAKVSIPIFSSLCSGLFYKMGKPEGSFPSVHDTTTLWQWVKEINKATGSDLYNGYCLETGTKDLLYTEDSLLCTTTSSIF